MPPLDAVDLIVRKRDGRVLEPAQVAALVAAYTRGEVPDYQMSAFLMAAFLRGLDGDETLALTEAMLHSGAVVDLSSVAGIKVDKHSTGGVGDKISLILAPVVAACGVPVPMISGRGLGHTGGTLDKLESIPGLRTDLSIDQYRRQLESLGIAMIGQTAEIAPADRKLYALRDVTGTVEHISFIAASIMSKKLAEGIDALVLDVKCGRGAFMKEEALARRLAETLVDIGERFGKQTVAWMTSMDVPLGRGVGNWPEMAESIRCLKGEDVADVMEVVYVLAGEMIWLGGAAASPEKGEMMARDAIASGAALQRFASLVEAQGGDPAVLDDPDGRAGFTPAGEVRVPAGSGGYVADIDAMVLGRTATRMGAGRLVKEDDVDPTAGLVLRAGVGERVEAGDMLAQLYTRQTDQLEGFSSSILGAFRFSDSSPSPATLLLDRYADGRWKSGIALHSA